MTNWRRVGVKRQKKISFRAGNSALWKTALRKVTILDYSLQFSIIYHKSFVAKFRIRLFTKSITIRKTKEIRRHCKKLNLPHKGGKGLKISWKTLWNSYFQVHSTFLICIFPDENNNQNKQKTHFQYSKSPLLRRSISSLGLESF